MPNPDDRFIMTEEASHAICISPIAISRMLKWTRARWSLATHAGAAGKRSKKRALSSGLITSILSQLTTMRNNAFPHTLAYDPEEAFSEDSRHMRPPFLPLPEPYC